MKLLFKYVTKAFCDWVISSSCTQIYMSLTKTSKSMRTSAAASHHLQSGSQTMRYKCSVARD